MVSHDELAIAIVVLVPGDSRRRLWFSTDASAPNSGGDGLLATSRKGFDDGVGRKASHGAGALGVGYVSALGNATEPRVRSAAVPS
jgi:hypothetical protein